MGLGRHMTRLGALAAHPMAFILIGSYSAGLMVVFFVRDTVLARYRHAGDVVHDRSHSEGDTS